MFVKELGAAFGDVAKVVTLNSLRDVRQVLAMSWVCCFLVTLEAVDVELFHLVLAYPQYAYVHSVEKDDMSGHADEPKEPARGALS